MYNDVFTINLWMYKYINNTTLIFESRAYSEKYRIQNQRSEID